MLCRDCESKNTRHIEKVTNNYNIAIYHIEKLKIKCNKSYCENYVKSKTK